MLPLSAHKHTHTITACTNTNIYLNQQQMQPQQWRQSTSQRQRRRSPPRSSAPSSSSSRRRAASHRAHCVSLYYCVSPQPAPPLAPPTHSQSRSTLSNCDMSLALPRTNHESDNAATTGDVGAEMTLAVYAYSVISRTCAHKRDLTVVAASVNAVLELAALRSVCGDNGPVLAGGVDDGAGVLLPPPKLTSVPMLDKKRVAAFLSRRDTRTRSTRRERNSRFALLHTREDGP
jgi:hypothetical protein